MRYPILLRLVKMQVISSPHKLINKVTFTGSTAVGKSLIEQSAQSVKNVTMELGGLAL